VSHGPGPTTVDSTIPALEGGLPVRPKDRPFPGVFPRAIPDAAFENVRAVLESGFTLNMIARFEQAFAEACGARFAVATANCTAAVHTVVGALQLLGRLEPGDEVLISPISDYGSVAGAVAQGCIPVFPDVDLRTGLVTAETLERAIRPRCRAVIVVHFYGMVCDMDPILALARRRGLTVIEDCCQAPLADYRGRKTGTLADAGCFSFDAEKHLSADHGGAITTDDPELAAACRRFAIDRGAVLRPGYGRVHASVGLNYRFGHLDAAVALAQLAALPEQHRRRVALAERLTAQLQDLPGVLPPAIPAGSSHVYWLYHVQFDPAHFRVPVSRLAQALMAEGLPGGLAPYYLIPESHTFLTDRAHAYGSAPWPWPLPGLDAATLPVYSAESVPNARQHLAHTYRWPWTDRYSEEDIDDMARIIRKVSCYYAR